MVACMFTNNIATFEEGASKPPIHAMTVVAQTTTFRDLGRAKYATKNIHDYRSEGLALLLPILTMDLNVKRLSLLFKQGNYFIQLYQSAGNVNKYVDPLAHVVTLLRNSFTPKPVEQLAPSIFCGCQGHEGLRSSKRIIKLTEEEAVHP